MGNPEKEFLSAIMDFIEKNGEIDNYRAQILSDKSAESVKKYFAALVEADILTAIGEKKGRKYKLNEAVLRIKNDSQK
ncbi:MAG: hypothetical protein LBH29_00470 [Elusimicrobiota bacterium]|nr:hypothetical protein [Elusimicrobiota bacterium]